MTARGVHLALGAEDQAIIVGDRDRLKQVLLNLVDNAVKYTPQGGKVTLSLAKDEAWVKITVQDTGIGIASENIPNLFDRFYRVDKSRTGPGGTGLGLAIVKHLAQVMGGTVVAANAPGGGAIFTVRLPVRSEK